MRVLEHGIDVQVNAQVNGEVELRIPLPDDQGDVATKVVLDGPVTFSTAPDNGAGRLSAHAKLQAPVKVSLAISEGRGKIDADLATNGQMTLRMALPGTVEELDGEVAIKGPIGVTLARPGSDQNLHVPASIEGTASIETTSTGALCLDAQGVLQAPIKFHLPVPGAEGEIHTDVATRTDVALKMVLPSGHGEITAKGVARGPVVLSLPLPAGRGQIKAQGSISTPYTLVMVTPDGRAKLEAKGIVTSDVMFDMAMRGGGWVQARVPVNGPTNLDLILPEGRGRIEFATPINTVVRLKDILIPEVDESFNIDIDANGAAELAIRLPEGAGEVQLRLEIAIPLAPLVRLACVQLERWVRVERMWLRAPHLDGAHDLFLPLYVEARRGLLAKVEVVANLYIDQRRQQLQLWSVRAHGLNATGSAVSNLYLNPGLLRQFNRQLLFDPATMLPPGATIRSLSFRSATRDRVTLVVEASFAV